MNEQNNALIMIVVLGVAIYLIYSQNKKINPEYHQRQPVRYQQPQRQPQIIQPPVTNITVKTDGDEYSDSIKRQDLYSMYDPLTYPQLRLSREVLEKYDEYYKRTGSYPPFNMATQPNLFDNPTLNGYLQKIRDGSDIFTDSNIPDTIPLFRIRSIKSSNRFFYYTMEQRYFSKLEMKIPIQKARINGNVYSNGDDYGIPELFDDDIIEDIPVYPGTRFKVVLYKNYHFP